MIEHVAAVRGRIVTWDDRRVVQHGMGADRVVLDLDAEWDACDRIQVALACASLEKPVRVIPEERAFLLPAQMLLVPGQLRMQVIGYEGDSVRLMTEREASPLVVVESGAYDGAVPPEPDQPDLWAKLMADVEAATKAASSAAGAATQAAQAAEAAAKSATDAAAKAESAASSTMEGELRRVRAEASRVEAERSRAAAESARAGAEDKRAASESARTEAEGARDAAEKAREAAEQGRAAATEEAVKKAADAAAKADEAATDAAAGEQGRVTAEHGRAEAEKARAAAEADRAKRADAAIAAAGEAAASAEAAAASATSAANKAESAVAQLPIPSGNVLKGEAESTFINLHDSWKAPILKGKVLGQSNQVRTTGKNLLGGERYVSGYNIRGFKNILKPNTKYTYSSSGITDGKAAFKLLAFNAQQSKEISLTVGYIKNASETFTTPENIGEFEELYLGGNYSDAGKNCISSHFQIEEGAKATAYEPYTGGKPSPSPEYPQEITNLTKAELVIAGKNLLEIYSLPNQPDSGISASMENDKSVTVNGMTTKDNVDLVLIDDRNKMVLPAGVYTLSVDSIGFPKDCIFFIRNASDNTWFANTNVEKPTITISLDKPTIIGECSVRIPTAGTKFSNARIAVQLEVGGKATGYTAPATKALTPIDLKGNELCSMPNGVKDEVVIDAEGNVSLIKRVAKIQSDKLAELVYEVYPADENGNLPYVICNFNDPNDFRTDEVRCNVRPTGNLKMDKSVYATFNALVVIDTRFTDIETAKQILKSENGIYYYEATPQTIPLGKVELPALPEATSNIWNDGNIPANVYINYLKDVNIAFADLESKLTQAVVATAANI